MANKSTTKVVSAPVRLQTVYIAKRAQRVTYSDGRANITIQPGERLEHALIDGLVLRRLVNMGYIVEQIEPVSDTED